MRTYRISEKYNILNHAHIQFLIDLVGNFIVFMPSACISRNQTVWAHTVMVVAKAWAHQTS